MSYRALANELRPAADAVAVFFREDRGVTEFVVEEEVHPTLPYRPTFHSRTPEQQIVAVDVRSEPYSNLLDSVVLHCIRNSLPLRLYVAFPAGVAPGTYKTCVDRARENGIGVVEVRENGCAVIHEALVLSLSSVRRIERRRYPARYREAIAAAESTFRGGNPVDGCGAIYREIEALSRELAKRTNARGLWSATAIPNFDFEKENWATVLDVLANRLRYPQVPSVTRHLITRIQAIVQYRNQTGGHKPRSLARRIQRDSELKTRFEAATDLFLDLTTACKPLRIHS